MNTQEYFSTQRDRILTRLFTLATDPTLSTMYENLKKASPLLTQRFEGDKRLHQFGVVCTEHWLVSKAQPKTAYRFFKYLQTELEVNTVIQYGTLPTADDLARFQRLANEITNA